VLVFLRKVLLVADLFREKSTVGWWLINQTNRAEDSVHQTFYQMRKYHSVSRQTNSKQTGEMKNYPEIVQARL
jgi:hypothetical protein